MTRMTEMAKDLGRALAQTDEYQVLKTTIAGSADDRELAELRTELEGLEGQIEAALRGGNEPTDELKSGYEETVGRLQGSATYQRLVSAQTNFDKVLLKVNQTIQEGIVEGAESRIIMP
ncbi:MAG TPA: YlbF family regulator [Gemmatimonadetes bacterium]|nr:YlbF family regulator [Gemmatimonadota bacterium]